MAVSDIFKYQHAYNTNGTFDDKSDWKTAFDIANGFTSAANNQTISLENWRKHEENMATKDNRVANMNAGFLSDTAKQHYDFNSWQGKQQYLDAMAKYQYDPSGRLRTPEEIRTLMYQNGEQLNAHAQAVANDAYRAYLGNAGQQIAPINPALASTFGVQAGMPWQLNADGSVVNFHSGQEVGKLPANIDPAMFATGNGYSAHTAQLKAEQEAARKVAEAQQKYDHQLAIAQAKAEAQADAKIRAYENYREHQNQLNGGKQDEAISKLFDGEKGILSSSMDLDINGVGTMNPQKLEAAINRALIAYPQYASQIQERASQIARQYGLKATQ